MEIVTGREKLVHPMAHRVTWFVPDRPVGGGTVFVRPGDTTPNETAVVSEGILDDQ